MENLRFVLNRLVNILLFIVGALLSLRIILKLLGANTGAPIVFWLYGVSEFLVYPFRGIFADLRFPGGQVVELASVIAFFAYLILGYLILSIINSLIHPNIHEDLLDEDLHEHRHGYGLR